MIEEASGSPSWFMFDRVRHSLGSKLPFLVLPVKLFLKKVFMSVRDGRTSAGFSRRWLMEDEVINCLEGSMVDRWLTECRWVLFLEGITLGCLFGKVQIVAFKSS